MKQKSKKKDDSVLEAINNLAMATGKGFDDMRESFSHVREDIADLQGQISRIESYILADHQRRLEEIEKRLGIKQ
jgi:hypothetical protein